MKTMVRGREEQCLSLSSPDTKVDITRFLERQRSNSSVMSDSIPESPTTGFDDDDTDECMSIDSPGPVQTMRRRTHFVSESDSQSSMTAEVITVCVYTLYIVF